MTHIDRLNRTLGEKLGFVCGGSLPRYAWKWAPSMPWFVYDSDDRTVIKKSWADVQSPEGPIGRVWMLAEWRVSKAIDHHGFGDQCSECKGAGSVYWGGGIRANMKCDKCGGSGRTMGVRVAVAREAGYSPYFESALARGEVPTEKVNQNYIFMISWQLSHSAEHDPRSLQNHLAEERYAADQREVADENAWLEKARSDYDGKVGAFGNCAPGKRDGFMSFQNVEKPRDAHV